MDLLQAMGLAPTGTILEIGCADGWRLKRYQERYGCEIYGIDPSPKAIAAAGHPNIVLGEARSLPWGPDRFNLVILGWCMIYTEPGDWFLIAHEVSRVLCESGTLIILDYWPVANSKQRHPKHGWTYYVDWKRIWASHPGFTVMTECNGVYDQCGITMLVKEFNSIPVRG